MKKTAAQVDFAWFWMPFCLACNTVPEIWHIWVYKGLIKTGFPRRTPITTEYAFPQLPPHTIFPPIRCKNLKRRHILRLTLRVCWAGFCRGCLKTAIGFLFNSQCCTGIFTWISTCLLKISEALRVMLIMWHSQHNGCNSTHREMSWLIAAVATLFEISSALPRQGFEVRDCMRAVRRQPKQLSQ